MTKNAKRFQSAVERINHKLKGVERLALVIGEPGLGKTETAIHYCAQSGAVIIRILRLMTGPWLMRKIVSELGASPSFRTHENFDRIGDLLDGKSRTIIFDEVDRLANETEVLEVLRDIHDVYHVPMVFIGEEAADKKLRTNRRFYRRFVEFVKFERLDAEGVRQFVMELSSYRFQDNAVDRIAAETSGKISDIISMIHRAEAAAATNNLKSIDAKDFG
jgi:DNA transposition AAA+ family ATPase